MQKKTLEPMTKAVDETSKRMRSEAEGTASKIEDFIKNFL